MSEINNKNAKEGENVQGIELCERYYYELGEAMLREKFADVVPLCAFGVAGSGSECFGYDDEISRDHDFEPGFCIFLPDEDTLDRRTEFLLEREYARLPKTFMGYERQRLSPVGGRRHGVIRMSEFFAQKTGKENGELDLKDWLFVPEQSLAEAVNGKVFRDDSGIFTGIRKRLEYMPNDVRLKKMAANLLIMGQAGQYNYERCIRRGETGGAQLALTEFVRSAIHTVFPLNRRYELYYKWSFRAMREMGESELAGKLEYLISSANGEEERLVKAELVEEICREIGKRLEKEGLVSAQHARTSEAERMAYEVNDRIKDGEIRNLHILAAKQT